MKASAPLQKETPKAVVTTKGKAAQNPLQLKREREETPLQKKQNPFVEIGGRQNPLQLRSADNAATNNNNSLQLKKNDTGLPDNLKAGVEAHSGYSMDDVRVHYNSSKPAQLQALAYAQGTDIHIAPGQEKHLPHEAWHVVQQKQGRVRATVQMKSGVAVNDDKGLEKEADVMGGKAGKKHTLKGCDDTNLISKTTDLIQKKTIQCFVIQLTAAADLAAAKANRKYLVNETNQLSTAGVNVHTAINGAVAGATRNSAAAGLRYYWQTLIDGFDGKKAEMYEAELLARQHHIPILSTNDLVDPDVRTETLGHVVATEVKTINSDATGNVNTLIKGADNQLGKRIANLKKIKIRIESRNNLWPDARYNNAALISSNTALKNWLTQSGVIPSLANAEEIQIEGINIFYDIANPERNFYAKIKGNGDVQKTGSLVWS